MYAAQIKSESTKLSIKAHVGRPVAGRDADGRASLGPHNNSSLVYGYKSWRSASPIAGEFCRLAEFLPVWRAFTLNGDQSIERVPLNGDAAEPMVRYSLLNDVAEFTQLNGHFGFDVDHHVRRKHLIACWLAAKRNLN